MAAGYAEKIADEVIAERQVEGREDMVAAIRDLLAEAAQRGYALGFGARG